MKLERTLRPDFRIDQKLNIPQPVKTVLENGLELYVLNQGEQDLIKLVFLFDAGTLMEKEFFQAYITNSMLLEGTRKYSPAEISEKLDFLGSFIRPSIDKDYGTITVYTLKKHLKETLDVVQDVILNPVFSEKEMVKNIQLKKQKYLLDLAKVKMKAKYHFQEMVFGSSHPYGKMPQIEFFDRLNRDLLIDFHSKHYNLSKCRLIAAGKVDNETVKVLTGYFSANEVRSPKNNEIFFFQPFENRKKLIPIENTQQVAVWLGKKIINRNHKDFIPFYIVNTILGGYFGSRLTKNIRETKGYTYGINSVLLALKLSGYFLIVTEAKKGRGNQVVEEIYKEMERLCNEKVTEDELTLVRNYMIGDMLRSFDSIFAIADGFQAVLENNMGMEYYKNLLEKIKTIDAEEIMQISRKYFEPDSFYETQVGALE